MQKVLIKRNDEKINQEFNRLNQLCSSANIEIVQEQVGEADETIQYPKTYIDKILKMSGQEPSIRDLSFWLDVDLEELLQAGCACTNGGCGCH